MSIRIGRRALEADVFNNRDNRFGVLFRNRHRVTGAYEPIYLGNVTRVVITAIPLDGSGEELVIDTTDLDGPVVEIPSLSSTDPDDEGWMYFGLGSQGLDEGRWAARVSIYQDSESSSPTELFHEDAERQRLILNVWDTYSG